MKLRSRGLPVNQGNILQHALGSHTECPGIICCKGRFGALSDTAKQVLIDEMTFLVARANRLADGKTSNSAESFVAIMHMLLGGRRINTQDGEIFERQVNLAGLTMTRGYEYHSLVQQKMDIPTRSPVLMLADRVRKRREAAKKYEVKRRHRRYKYKSSVAKSSYQKETVNTFKDDEELVAVVVEQRLAQLDKLDTEQAKKLIDVDSCEFLQVSKDRLFPNDVALILSCNSEDVSKTRMKEILEVPRFVPWHLIELSADKLLAEKQKKTKVVTCGIFVHPLRKFMASKPDGVMDLPGQGMAVYRSISKCQTDEFLHYLAQADMLATGFSFAVYVVSTSQRKRLITIEKDVNFVERIGQLRKFHRNVLLPNSIKQES
jgi:hypothetical protein